MLIVLNIQTVLTKLFAAYKEDFANLQRVQTLIDKILVETQRVGFLDFELVSGMLFAVFF